MSFNRSLLTQITKDLNKKPSKPKVPKNQWQHPGEITNIPSNNITMDGVSYPVLGVPNVGQAQMMYPNQDYLFPDADNVMEYPMMQKGGLLSRSVTCSSCGHSWKAVDGGSDPMTCHKCGGSIKMKSGGQHGGLDRWFAEKWVDVKSGKPCGRQEGESRAGYPACRPSKRVSSDTPKTASELSPAEREKFKRSKTSSERINYQHRRKQYGGDTMDYNYDYPTELMAKGGNVPTNPALWSRAKSAARSKYDVYPSAYANGFAAKWYKSHGGGWRKGQYGMEVMGQGGTNNPGFQALPDYVQHKILSEMSFGGYMPEFGSGGYTVTRSSDRKGKTHKVTGPDGTVKYFGDSKLGQHPKDPERKAAFYARHKKNLDGNPYFRAFARATWQTGGQTRNEREMVNGIADILAQVRDPQNRAEIAKQMMSDFRRDDVAYNQQKFLEMSELKYGGMQKYQTAGQVIKPKKGFIDLSEYGYNALDADGIAKAEELNKMYPGSKFVCTAKGCADIARQIGDAKGYDFGRNNAWGYRGNIPELYTSPGYQAELDAGKPLHDPRSYAFPEEVKQLSGVLVGLNRKDNFDGKMAKTTAEANDSKDYANRKLYTGNNAGNEHDGFFYKGNMYHGTGPSKDHPAFYVIDDPNDGIALPGIARYNVVNAMGEPGLMDRAASTFNSVTGSVADAFNDFKAKFIKQQGGTAYNEMVQRLAYKKKGGLLKAQVGKQNPFFPNLNPEQEAADAQAQMPLDTNPSWQDKANQFLDKFNNKVDGFNSFTSNLGNGYIGKNKEGKLVNKGWNIGSIGDNSMALANNIYARSLYDNKLEQQEANRQMLRSQNATWNQQYDSMMNRGDYSQGPSSYGLYKPDQMSVPGFFADGGLTSLDVALGMAPTMVPNLTPDLNYAAFDMPATRTSEAATTESYNLASAPDVTGLELDPDKMLEAIAGSESGSKKGQSKVGMSTKLVGEGGKKGSASGTFQITDGTLKQIYKKDQFNDVFPTFNAFKAAFDKDPQVEYQAARSLAVDHIKNYGVYALGAWYYPEFASRAAKGDMTVMNQIPRADFGNKQTWGQNFNKNLNSYKKALGKSQFGGEMELTMDEIQQIKAMGGKVEFC
jgi:hypothetical protein